MVSDYDKKLAEKMIYYIEEAYTIMKMINTKEDKEEIKIRYKRLKQNIKNEAHRCDLIANRKEFTQFEKQYYAPSIKEANAWGFTSPINAKINRDFYNSVEEAHYKLRKYISLENLKRMIDEK